MKLFSLDNKNFISTDTVGTADLNKSKISIEKEENGNYIIYYDEKPLQVTIKATQGITTRRLWRYTFLQIMSETPNRLF